jgi:hypothetical protein
MKECPHCQQQNLDEAAVCNYCGKPFTIGSSLPDIEDVVKGQKKKAILILIIVLIICGGVGYWLYRHFVGPQVYTNFDKEFSQMNANTYRNFWTCALQRKITTFSNSEELRSHLMKLSKSMPKRYGEYLRSKCWIEWRGGLVQLQSLTPPEVYVGAINDIIKNFKKVQNAWQQFISYLLAEGERRKAKRLIEAGHDSWFTYVRPNSPEDRREHRPVAERFLVFSECTLKEDLNKFKAKVDPTDRAAGDRAVGDAILEKCQKNVTDFFASVEENCIDILKPGEQKGFKPPSEAKINEAIKIIDDGRIVARSILDCQKEAYKKWKKELIEDITKSWYEYALSVKSLHDITEKYAPGKLTRR